MGQGNLPASFLLFRHSRRGDLRSISGAGSARGHEPIEGFQTRITELRARSDSHKTPRESAR